MIQVKCKVSKKAKNNNNYYPSAELLQNVCYEDYRRVIDTYDKIYEKVNIALAFSGIVFIVIVSSFDYTLLKKTISCISILELFSLLLFSVCSFLSTVLIAWAVIQLLLLLRSRKLTVFDSMAIRNDEMYRKTVDVASMWLIDKYTLAINELRTIISEKQRLFDSAVTKIVISLICFAIEIIIQKGF